MNLSNSLRISIREMEKRAGSLNALEKKIGVTGLAKFLKGEYAGINTTTIDKILEIYPDVKIQDLLRCNDASNVQIANIGNDNGDVSFSKNESVTQLALLRVELGYLKQQVADRDRIIKFMEIQLQKE